MPLDCATLDLIVRGLIDKRTHHKPNALTNQEILAMYPELVQCASLYTQLAGFMPSAKAATTISQKLVNPRINVEFPETVQRALRILQSDPQNIEYGGSIDFDIDPQTREGVFDEFEAIRGQIDKINISRYDDEEIEWHTHPDRDNAYPSKADIRHFMNDLTKQASLIVAKDDFLLIEKTDETPKVDISDSEFKTVMEKINTPFNYFADPFDALRELGEKYHLAIYRIPVNNPIIASFRPIGQLTYKGGSESITHKITRSKKVD